MTFTKLVQEARQELIDEERKFVRDLENMVISETTRIANRLARCFARGDDRELTFSLRFINGQGTVACNCRVLYPANEELQPIVSNIIDKEIHVLLEICDRVVNTCFDDVVVDCVEMERILYGYSITYKVYSPLFPKPDLQPRRALSYLNFN
jgi:hypothetical protein